MIKCKNNLDPILHNIGSNEIRGYELTVISIIDKELTILISVSYLLM